MLNQVNTMDFSKTNLLTVSKKLSSVKPIFECRENCVKCLCYDFTRSKMVLEQENGEKVNNLKCYETSCLF